jgi:hypothetical protein
VQAALAAMGRRVEIEREASTIRTSSDLLYFRTPGAEIASRIVRLLPAFIVFCIAGCGTLANLQGRQYALISKQGERPVRVYGGVRNDFEWASAGIGFPSADDAKHRSASKSPLRLIEGSAVVAVGLPVLGYFAVVDPILSFVGDTLTLPRVIEAIRESDGQSASEELEAEGG